MSAPPTNCTGCGKRLYRTNYSTTMCNDCRVAQGISRNVGTASRSCAACGGSFLPNGNRQLFCLTCIPSKKWRAIYRRYGITKPQWDVMYEQQHGLCGCCEKPLPDNEALIHVDHCHTQGHVRELLCNICNGGLAFIENDKWMGQAFRYIQRHRR
jgi:hypothetical protein